MKATARAIKRPQQMMAADALKKLRLFKALVWWPGDQREDCIHLMVAFER